MAYRRIPFAPGEWYHLYSRGIEKRQIFIDEADFRRFRALLYLANSVKAVNFDTIRNIPYEEIFTLPRGKTLVSIGAYCMMTNHPHLIVQEKEEGGITTFMHKFGTAYTSYFNRKHKRVGNLMVKPFRSKHIGDDKYLRWVIQYVHLNPAEIFEPTWKMGKVRNIEILGKQLLDYKFSSLPDYFGETRPERSILDENVFKFIEADLPKFDDLLLDAAKYYAEIEAEFQWRPRGHPKGVTFSQISQR